MKKYYIAIAIDTNYNSDWTIYEGTDVAQAIKAAREYWHHLTAQEQQSRFVEVQEYDVPDEWEDMDSDERYLWEIEQPVYGYNTVEWKD